MRKIFLATSLLGTIAASAQQEDFFDIQKHLKKKTESKNTLANTYTLPSNQSQLLGSPPYSFNNLNEKKKAIKNNLYLELIKKRRYGLIPQAIGSMPCLTTDLSTFNMPNCFDPKGEMARYLQPGDLPGKMPNVADNYHPVR
jgi:hypothetical protein